MNTCKLVSYGKSNAGNLHVRFDEAAAPAKPRRGFRLFNSRSVRLSLLTLAAGLAAPAFAYWTPIQINLAGPAGLPPLADDVWMIRANALYGSCSNVAFIDAGLFNRVTEGVYGIRAGGVNWSEGDAYGLTAGAFNIDKNNAGLVMGAFNYTKTGSGFQIGLINVADSFTGVQIGVLNFHFNSAIPVFPLFNMGSGSGK